MELRELPFDSPGYRAALDLRHELLREPLGLEWDEEELAFEPHERHFALVEGQEEEVVACVTARPLSDSGMKLRQMAVASDRQGGGTGRKLLDRVEAVLRADGVTELELNAREGAVGFYEKLGYCKVGEPFEEVGITHWKMVKAL